MTSPTSEIARRDDTPALVPTDLIAWVEDAKAAHTLAQSLCRTSFVPTSYKGKPEEATAAILAGKRWGLDPIASVNAFDIIQGTPAPRALTLRAIVQAAGHELWIESASDTEVIAGGRRRGADHSVRSVWTIDRAKRAGLTSKDNWQKQPQAMLTARATAEVARLIAADALLGIAYTAEELRDEPTLVTAEVAPSPLRGVLAAARAEHVDTTTGEVTDTPMWDDPQIAAELAADEVSDRG